MRSLLFTIIATVLLGAQQAPAPNAREMALGVLERASRPFAPRMLIGDAVAYRSASRVAPRPVAAFAFARNERIKVEWPILAPLDRREARLLDHTGKPLPVDLPLAEDPARGVLVVDMSLS